MLPQARITERGDSALKLWDVKRRILPSASAMGAAA